jgi:site-specific DNA-methyltransferase (adenine-specific)
MWDVIHGDNVDVLRGMPSGIVDAVIADPQYGLSDHKLVDVIACLKAWLAGEPFVHSKKGFMGKEWDGWVPGPELWREASRALKAGRHLAAFSGARTHDLAGMAIRLSDLELIDSLMWLHSHLMPKSKGGLKTGFEPIILARQRGAVTPLNIDDCRQDPAGVVIGRWPTNVIHDGSDEVVQLMPDAKGQQGGLDGNEPSAKMGQANTYGRMDRRHTSTPRIEASKSAARFYYCARASASERGEGNYWPSVKPVALMRWLVRLLTKPGEIVLDMFCGSGTTGIAALLEGRRFIGIDSDERACEISRRRLSEVAEWDPFWDWRAL